ncbi:AfsR/SARP family transcriptional regulator [Mycobacterium sp. E2497]|uniref:AfsR/SARP family transcriptional regulator n=1 Tax=Mycobacterium sp. E2497 TaxID=1834135 RepID=UPI0008024698|nr:AfsR/SARP family transcriptional regulator [Mycobacterium sp. E2497]OBI23915.1 transcriptional regulator [Mycobacterium sp. E2497]
MVEYFLSGVVEARVDGARAALGGPKQRCVLAVLLANIGAVVSIDRLIDSVWEDDPPPKALASLRSYVTNLRRMLGPADAAEQRLQSRPYGYQLNLLDGDSIDLHHFEQRVSLGRSALLRDDPTCAVEAFGAALSLWHGDPFGEFTYRDFAAPDALRYAELRTTAIEARFDAALRLGSGTELIPEIEAALAQYPLQERLWEHLMRALHRAGRTADATRAFHRASATLEREIGARPGEDLQNLFRRISAEPNEIRDEWPAGRARAASGRLAVPGLVGRDAELGAVLSTARLAAAGVGGLTLITGESGIGKTALAQTVADQVRADDVAVSWASHPSAIKLPLLWTWIQLLRQLGAGLGDAGRRAVKRAAPGVVDTLVPEWNDIEPLAPSTRVAATGFAVVEGIVTALEALSSIKPLLIVLDDLQLADGTSRNALSLLAAMFPRVPIQVIGTWTYHGVDRPVNRSSFESLIRSNDTSVVHLNGIDREAAALLVDSIAGVATSRAVTEQVWQQAGGNPFYLKEIARTLQAASAGRGGADIASSNLSDAVVGVVGRRLATLERASRRLVAAAAVIGPEFDVAELADVVDLTSSAVQRRLRPAYQAGLLDEVPGRPGMYRFSHGILRDALLAQLDTTERTTVHAAVATARAAGLAAAAYEDGIAAADHAWRAGTELHPETALELHETVIQRALTRSAYDDVASLADHALQICRKLPAKPEELERQATLWLHLAGAKGILEGQTSAAAADAVQRAFEIGSQVKGRSFYGAIALQCLMLCGHGRIDEAHIIANGLREQYDLTGDPDIGVVNDFAHIMVYSLRGDVEALIATGRHMMDTFPPPETVTDPMHFFHPRVYCWMALGEAIRGDRDAMREYHRRALHLAQSRGDVFNILAAKLTFVECAAILGDVEGTAELADAVDREFCAAGGQQWGAAARIISVWARTLENGEGDRDAAFEAFGALTSDGSTAMTPFFLALLADIENHHRRSDNARELLGRAQRVADATGEHASDSLIAARLAGLSQVTDRPG